MFWYWDTTYVLVIIGAIICAVAALNVNITFNNFSKLYNRKGLRLSDSVYGSTSIAAIGVAVHECGHAIQHKKDIFL